MREKKSTHELLENEELCECYAREYFSVFFLFRFVAFIFVPFFYSIPLGLIVCRVVEN